MAHHKRGKPKSSRAGCLLCNPQKRQGSPLKDRQRASQLRLMQAADVKIAEALVEAPGLQPTPPPTHTARAVSRSEPSASFIRSRP